MIRLTPIISFSYMLFIVISELVGYITKGFPDWQWDPRFDLAENLNRSEFLNPYYAMLFIPFLSYIIYSLSKSLYIELMANSLIIGKVLKIEQSNNRVNNRNLTNILVEYGGLEGNFADQDADYITSLNKNDLVVIRYIGNSLDKAIFEGRVDEVSEDIIKKSKENPLSLPLIELNNPHDMAKIINIEPNYELGRDFYDLNIELHTSDYQGHKATITGQFTPDKIKEFIPGRMMQCVIEGKGDDMNISIIG